MTSVILAPVFTPKDGQFDALLNRIRQQRDDCLAHEPGCLHFDVLTSPDRKGQIFLYEIYVDQAAVKQHREYSHYKSFKADTADMVAEVDLKIWELDGSA